MEDSTIIVICTIVIAISTAAIWWGKRARDKWERLWQEAQIYDKNIIPWIGYWMSRKWWNTIQKETRQNEHEDSTNRTFELTSLSITLHGVAAEYQTDGKSNVAWGLLTREEHGHLVFQIPTRWKARGGWKITMAKRPQILLAGGDPMTEALVTVHEDKKILWSGQFFRHTLDGGNSRQGGSIHKR